MKSIKKRKMTVVKKRLIFGWLCLLCCLCVSLSLVACGGQSETTAADGSGGGFESNPDQQSSEPDPGSDPSEEETTPGDETPEAPPAHEHTYSTEWSWNEMHHWYAATCEHPEETQAYGEHQYDDGEVLTPVSCTKDGKTLYTCICGYQKTETVKATDHSYSEEWSWNATHHWHELSCGHLGESGDYAKHSYDRTETVPATCKNDGKLIHACICGAQTAEPIPVLAHNYVNGACTECDAPEASRYVRVDGNGVPNESGTCLLFGSYPQAAVTNVSILDALNGMISAYALPTERDAGAWTSYGYYASWDPVDSMWYLDVTYEGERYRGVYFTAYRPSQTSSASSAGSSAQDENGYTVGTVYWFRYEPILWQILKEQEGRALLLCRSIIDSREAYYWTSNRSEEGVTVKPNNYAYSAIRAWLNASFYETAFDSLQRELIQLTLVDNSANTTGSQSNPHACEDTEDHIFLPSCADLLNADYGFGLTSNVLRQRFLTDYALCQGGSAVTVTNNFQTAGTGHWWLRSPAPGSSAVSAVQAVTPSGDVGAYNTTCNYICGVCPMLWVELT